MIPRLFGSRRRDPDHLPEVPKSSRVYAIGDIHGRVDLLGELHEMVLEDAERWPDRRKVVVYIGDYVDRGLQSRQVIDLLLDAPLRGFEVIHLKGNHEDMMLAFLKDVTAGPEWMLNGGDATLYSYGVNLADAGNMDERLEMAQAELRRHLPQRHLDFLESLKLTHAEGDYFFVHAGIRPGVALDRQDELDMLWIRDEFLYSPDDHGKVVVHGHTITGEPEVRPNRIGLDTGAFASGTLTCLTLDGTERSFLQTLG